MNIGKGGLLRGDRALTTALLFVLTLFLGGLELRAQQTGGDTYWQFPEHAAGGGSLEELPPVLPEEAAPSEPEELIALMPPVALPAGAVVPAPNTAAPLQELPVAETSVAQEPGPSQDLLVALGSTGMPTETRVQELALEKIQKGYAFAKRGAYFAARREFVEVLRMLTRQMDTDSETADRSVALAEGLRAMDEAADFLPQGLQLEAELDVAAICASHQTQLPEPVAAGEQPQRVLDRYLRVAQKKLGFAVEGEPAGSMALHALGKLHSQMGMAEPDRNPIASRRAVALQQAALLAREDNYLAAHELGVLLAEAGQLERSEAVLTHVANVQPNSVVLRNLAAVQKRLGQQQEAAASLRQAELLARAGLTPPGGVELVPPERFAQMATRPNEQAAPAGSQAGVEQVRVARHTVWGPADAWQEGPPKSGERKATSFDSPARRWW